MSHATALLVTSDDDLLEAMLRLAAAAGVILDVAHDTAAALRGWASAGLVLVGTDQVATLAAAQPFRRGHVSVIGQAPVPDGLFRSALLIGAQSVAELPAAESWLVELLTDLDDGGARRARVIGVVGGSGGSGATTLASALARSAASRSSPALLLDLDPLGGGVDRVLGLDDIGGVRWDALLSATGRFSAKSLRDALPERDGLAVLTWGAGSHARLDALAVREVFSAAQRGNDVVVVDLPRHADAVTEEVVPRCDHLVLVTRLTVPAVAASSRMAAALQSSARRLWLVTRGRSSALAPEDAVTMLGLPLLASMPDQRRLEEWIDLGLGPVHSRRAALASAARAVLEQLDPIPVRAA